MRRLIYSGVLWIATQTVVRQIVSFGVFVLLGRLLSPADFGTVSLCVAILSILQAFTSQGLAQAVIQKSNLSSDEASVAYTYNLIVSSALAVIIIVSCVFYGFFLSATGFVDFLSVLMVLALLVPVSALFEIHQAKLVRDFNFGLIAQKTVASQILSGLIALGAALFGFGVWSLVAQQVSVVAIDLVIVRSASDWRPKYGLDRELVLHLTSFGIFLFGARFLNVVDLRIPEIVIGAVIGQSSVGFFRVARSMQDVVMSIFAQPIHGLALPLFAARQHQIVDIRRAYLRMSEAISWLVFPPFAVLFFWGPTIIVSIFGSQWSSSGWILQILSLQCIVFATFYLYDPLLVALGQTRSVFKVRCAQTGASLICLLITAMFGFEYIVSGRVVALFAATPVMFFYLARATELKFLQLVNVVWRPFLCSLAFVALAEICYRTIMSRFEIIGLIAALAIAYGFYCAAFFICATFDLRTAATGMVGQLMRRATTS
jgi:O-antigen/teichoic acid export membrane protein